MIYRAMYVALLAMSIAGCNSASGQGTPPGACTTTANYAMTACTSEVEDDFWIAKAICINISDTDERLECENDADVEKVDETALCGDQKAARLAICGLVGEDPYDPDDIGDTVAPNP